MIHELKISPEYFDAVAQGIKSFEVRKNDRNFKVGDVLSLDEYIREYDDCPYTGRTTRKVITYILNDADYCKEGYVVLGLALAKEE